VAGERAITNAAKQKKKVARIARANPGMTKKTE